MFPRLLRAGDYTLPMTGPITYDFFTVTGFFQALTTDTPDAGGDPQIQYPTGLVTFTPDVPRVEAEALTPMTTVFLQPIQGRIDTDGRLKTLDSCPVYYKQGTTRNPIPGPNLTPVWAGTGSDPTYYVDSTGAQTAPPAGTPIYGVRLAANTAALGPLSELSYRVDFSKVVYDGAGRVVPSFTFPASTADVEVDMATLWS